MKHDLARLVRRLETAQALQSRSFLLAARIQNPKGPAQALHGSWGFAHFFAEGHFLNQALALGLTAPLSAHRLDRIEALMGQGAHPVVLELAPTAAPDLMDLLAHRGYRIQAFQQVLSRELGAGNPLSPSTLKARLRVRAIGADEMERWCRVVQAGFQDQDELGPAEETASGFNAEAEGNQFLLATVDDVPAGASVLGCFGGIGVFSGTSVLPRFRGLGLQRELLRARLDLAREAGCRRVCSAVLPNTASQMNLERCGFRVVYPKLEMARVSAGDSLKPM